MDPEADLGDGKLSAEVGMRRRSASISDDYSVQKTNDDATECKYTAAKLNYFKDAYVRRFVMSETPRRDPEISRGYWARVVAIKAVVDGFLQKYPHGQIVNIGSGFDTLFWRLKECGKPFRKFVEVDFSSVTAKKIRMIRKPGQPNLVEMFDGKPEEAGHADLHAGSYYLVGADLRQFDELRAKLDKCNLDVKTPTLFIAECVLVYMSTEQSNNLLAKLSSWYPVSFFLNYEQVNTGDTFGEVMLMNLHQRGILLPGLAACESVSAQVKRFVENGWKNVVCKTMLDIYQKCLPQQEVRRIETIEFLDEKILLSQLLEHYCLIVASNWDDMLDFIWST